MLSGLNCIMYSKKYGEIFFAYFCNEANISSAGNMKMLSFKCIEAGLVLLKSYLMTIINFVTCLSISQQCRHAFWTKL